MGRNNTLFLEGAVMYSLFYMARPLENS